MLHFLRSGRLILRKEFDFYVSSADGDDGNAGSNPDAPLATLGALSWEDGMSVGLVAGSLWREALNEPTIDNAILSGALGAQLPRVEGTNVVAVWTPHATEADVWEASIAHDDNVGGNTNRLTVYEDGTLLTRVANAATASSTPASFVNMRASVANPQTAQIHTSDSSDPNTNGKVYEVTFRTQAVFLGDGATVRRGYTRAVMSNDGSVKVGNNATVENWLTVDGTKHNALVESGDCTDFIACRSDSTTSYETAQSYFVNFTNDSAGRSVSWTRCGTVADRAGSRFGGSYINHDASAHSYASFTGEQLWCVDVSSGWDLSAEAVTLNGYYAKNANNALLCFTDAGIIDHLQVNNLGVSISGRITPRRITAGTIKFRHCVFAFQAGSSALVALSNALNGASLEFEHCVFYLVSSRPIFETVGTAWGSGGVGTLKINNCIFAYPASATAPIFVPANITYEGDNNVFVCNNDAGTNLNLNYQGVVYDTLATWRTASGQDANSVAFGPSHMTELFSGTLADGDFRLGGTGAGSTAAGLTAGPQTHWDWNARASAAGPPTAWPNAPDTLAECETYTTDPAAWDF
jgi:hypothetical protein